MLEFELNQRAPLVKRQAHADYSAKGSSHGWHDPAPQLV